MELIDFEPHANKGLKIVADFLGSLQLSSFGGTYFRGHAARSWTLTPFGHRKGNVGIENVWELGAWAHKARRFFPDRSLSELEYLVLAQHFGVHTSLLDWTINPLIALFFACEPADDASPDGVVLQVGPLLAVTEPPASADMIFQDRNAPILIDTSTMNIRSTAQDSMMTLHSRGENPLAAEEVFVIAEADKYLVRHALEVFGISPERVYADLGVAATHFNSGLRASRQEAAEQHFKSYLAETACHHGQ